MLKMYVLTDHDYGYVLVIIVAFFLVTMQAIMINGPALYTNKSRDGKQ